MKRKIETEGTGSESETSSNVFDSDTSSNGGISLFAGSTQSDDSSICDDSVASGGWRHLPESLFPLTVPLLLHDIHPTNNEWLNGSDDSSICDDSVASSGGRHLPETLCPLTVPLLPQDIHSTNNELINLPESLPLINLPESLPLSTVRNRASLPPQAPPSTILPSEQHSMLTRSQGTKNPTSSPTSAYIAAGGWKCKPKKVPSSSSASFLCQDPHSVPQPSTLHKATKVDANKTLSHQLTDGVRKKLLFQAKAMNGSLVVREIILVDPTSGDAQDPFVMRNSQGHIVIACWSMQGNEDIKKRSSKLSEKVTQLRDREDAKPNGSKKSTRLTMPLFGYNSTTVNVNGLYVHWINLLHSKVSDWGSTKLRSRCHVEHGSSSAKLLMANRVEDEELVREIGSELGYVYATEVCRSDRDKEVLLVQKDTMATWEEKIKKDVPSLFMAEDHCPEDIDTSILGDDRTHTSCVCASSMFTGAHIDCANASYNWGGVPDKHVCLTENPNIGFLLVVPEGENECRLVLITQRAFNCTFFYAADFFHGAVHISTYLNAAKSHSDGNLGVSFHGQPSMLPSIMSAPVNHRVFISYYSKASVPVLYHTLISYNILQKYPITYIISSKGGNGKGKNRGVKTGGAMSKDRELKSVKIDYNHHLDHSNWPAVHDNVQIKRRQKTPIIMQ